MDENKKKYMKEEEHVTLIRIMGKDVPGDKALFAGLTRIPGISWAFANAICKTAGLDKTERIQDIDKGKLEELRKHGVRQFGANRRR